MIRILQALSLTIALCHTSFAQAIVNGNEALPGDHNTASVVAILSAARDRNSVSSLMCGGTLISERHVLTAAHCVFDYHSTLGAVQLEGSSPVLYIPPEYIVVMAGSLQFSSAQQRHYHIVQEVHAHPLFRPFGKSGLENDIAILELEASVFRAQPVTLFGGNSLDLKRQQMRIYGWGDTRSSSFTEANEPSLSDSLRYAELPLLPLDKCESSRAFETSLTAEYLCAGKLTGTQIDSCQGDSGGPLFGRQRRRLTTQFGVVSFGIGCSDRYRYGIYTNVSHHRLWIDSIVKAQWVH